MNQARFGSQQHLGVIKQTSELPRRVLIGNRFPASIILGKLASGHFFGSLSESKGIEEGRG